MTKEFKYTEPTVPKRVRKLFKHGDLEIPADVFPGEKLTMMTLGGQIIEFDEIPYHHDNDDLNQK